MSETAEQLKVQLAGLPVIERAELADFLLQSLDDDDLDDNEPLAVQEELDRRWAEIEDGTAKGRSAEEVLARLEEKYG